MFHVSDKHVPGWEITTPFYIEVEYSYYKGGLFNSVLSVKTGFKSLDYLKWNTTLINEIEAAARNNLRNTCLDDPDDISDALSGMPEVDMEIQNELHRTGHK